MKKLSILSNATNILLIALLIAIQFSLFTVHCFSQGVAININGVAADTSAMLDISSTNQGILIPRMTSSQRDVIPTPAVSLLIYNATTDKLNYYKTTGWYELSSTFLSSNKGTISPGGGTAINTNGAAANPSAILEIVSTTRGLLVPRTSPDSITSPAKGLIIYDISANRYKYFNGTEWKTICESFITTTTGSGNLTSMGTAINIKGSSADKSAMLDISNTTKGLLIPRMSTSERDLILPKQGLIVYENNTTNTIDFSDGTNWFNLITEPPVSPIAATNVPSDNYMVWNWNTVSGATGYKWNTTDDYSTATETIPAGSTSYTQTGITCNTPYTLYIWAFNDCGNSTFTILSDTTSVCVEGCPGVPTVTDVEGNVYNTVAIGTQCWFKENLKVTKFNDGSAIANVTSGATWVTLKTAAYSWWNNDVTYKSTYGALYNWYAASTINLCPTGWHVPTDNDFTTLERAVCSSSTCITDFPFGTLVGFRGTDEGGKLKEAGTTHWFSPNTGATNSSGFSALPAGNRIWGGGQYQYMKQDAYFWSSTKEPGTPDIAWYRLLDYNDARSYRYTILSTNGCSIRCLKN